MAPNNALGNPTASQMRDTAERKSPAAKRRSKSPASRKSERSEDSVRISSADGFGAGGSQTSVLDCSEVSSRGTGTAIRTPLEDFEARPRDEYKTFWSAHDPNPNLDLNTDPNSNPSPNPNPKPSPYTNPGRASCSSLACRAPTGSIIIRAT